MPEHQISRDEALRRLREMGGDPEEDHLEADRILLALIGDEEIEAAFWDFPKWYA